MGRLVFKWGVLPRFFILSLCPIFFVNCGGGNSFSWTANAIEWPFTQGTDALYACTVGGRTYTGTEGLNHCNIDLTSGIAELTPSSQIDNSSNCTTGFGDGVTSNCGGTYAGSAEYNQMVTLSSALNSNLQLSSDWTPAFSNLMDYWSFNNTLNSTVSGANADFTPLTGSISYPAGPLNLSGNSGANLSIGSANTSALISTQTQNITFSAWVTKKNGWNL